MTYFLYDLLEDPYEMHDLSDKLPLKAKQMKTSLLEWIEAVAKSRGPSETNCQAMLPPPSPPSPSPAAGPFKPIVTRTTVAETCVRPSVVSDMVVPTGWRTELYVGGALDDARQLAHEEARRCQQGAVLCRVLRHLLVVRV